MRSNKSEFRDLASSNDFQRRTSPAADNELKRDSCLETTASVGHKSHLESVTVGKFAETRVVHWFDGRHGRWLRYQRT